MRPLFSIIIPTFNACGKLERTLSSIRTQELADVEILVQDGGSSDGTHEFLEGQSDLKWESEADGGIYDAMNKAIQRSKGQYLLFMGAGDCIEAGVLKKVALYVESKSGHNFVYGNVRLDDGVLYDGLFSPSKLRTKNICQQAIFYERTLFERLGLFDTRYPLLADWEFNFRCFGDADVEKTFLPIVIASYEGNGRSATPDTNFLRDRLKLIYRHLGIKQLLLALAAKLIPTSLKSFLKGRSA